MRIIIEELPPGSSEDELVVRCKSMTPKIMSLIAAAKMPDAVTAYKGQDICMVQLEDACYFEAVDNKTFLYTDREVYEVKQRLYELEEELGGNFQRVSKSAVLNLARIASLRPALNGRLEATLDNGEKVIVSRQYVSLLKNKYGL